MLMQKYDMLEAEYEETLAAEIDPSKPPIRDNLRGPMARSEAESGSERDATQSEAAGASAEDPAAKEAKEREKEEKAKQLFEQGTDDELFGDHFDNSICITDTRADQIKAVMREIDITPPPWAANLDDETFRKAILNLAKR